MDHTTNQPLQDSFKVYFDNEKDIRRVSLDSKNFDEVIKQLHTLYSGESLFHPELRIQYIDEEGDKVTVSSQAEWLEMFNTVGKIRPIKLYITEGSSQGRYFKDGPPPVAQYCYIKPKEEGSVKDTLEDSDSDEKVTSEEPETKLVEGEVFKEISVAVPKCLERLFPGGRILPYHLPEWLEASGCIKRIPVPNSMDSVDLDVDVSKLLDVLHEESIKCIGEDKSRAELEKGKDYLFCMLEMEGDNKTALYNLACAEALLGNLDSAVAALEETVANGYNNVQHIEDDGDLRDIRHLEGYKRIIRRLKGEAEEDQEVMKEDEKETEEVKMQEENSSDSEEMQEDETKVEDEKVDVEKEVVMKVDPVASVVPQKEVEKAGGGLASIEDSFAWKEQRATLVAMGFDQSVVEFLLTENKGDTNVVLEQMLQTPHH